MIPARVTPVWRIPIAVPCWDQGNQTARARVPPGVDGAAPMAAGIRRRNSGVNASAREASRRKPASKTPPPRTTKRSPNRSLSIAPGSIPSSIPPQMAVVSRPSWVWVRCSAETRTGPIAAGVC